VSSLADLQRLVEKGATLSVSYEEGDDLPPWPIEYLWTDGRTLTHLWFSDSVWEKEHTYNLAFLGCVEPEDQHWRAVDADYPRVFDIEPITDEGMRAFTDRLVVAHEHWGRPEGVWLYTG
jgi:hypothetical protein